uniref:Glucose dehydrogenase [FAD, quinone]-like n=1 Tax=Saccoglossus kowalevskii TaxID=10224 RepID=A0ABM0MC43_SACKO|nr:PREDICTED: glucose dehydrogenase [FAD, quinone]-like [Saccoglossus kowalevskii]
MTNVLNRSARYAATSSHHQGGPMTVSDTAPVTKLPTVVMDAVRELGYKEKDINDGEMLGFMRAQTTVSQDGRRHHTANAFLHPAENRKNLTIRANSVACKILFDGLRAVGVKYRSRFTDTEVYANKEIILCAGTIASSQLLMLSGVGPRNHLENLGISVIADLPVGKNLQDHLILVPMRISGPETLPPPDPKWPDIQLHCQIGYYHRGPNENRFLNFSEMFAKPLQHDISFEERAKKSGLALMVMICRPKSVGEIRLRTTNPFDHPIIDPQYLSHPSDVRTMIEGCRFSKKMTETKAFKKYGAEAEYYNFPNCSHPFDSDGYWEYVVRHASTSVYHTVGTCKMGAVNDPTAVVDSSLRGCASLSSGVIENICLEYG